MMDLPPVSDDEIRRHVERGNAYPVRRWVEADPAITAGRLTYEIRPWCGIPGSTRTEFLGTPGASWSPPE